MNFLESLGNATFQKILYNQKINFQKFSPPFLCASTGCIWICIVMISVGLGWLLTAAFQVRRLQLYITGCHVKLLCCFSEYKEEEEVAETNWQGRGGESANINIRLVHLDVEDTSEELLAPAILCHKEPARSSGQLAPATLSTNESQASTFLDQWEWTRLINIVKLENEKNIWLSSLVCVVAVINIDAAQPSPPCSGSTDGRSR